MSKRAFHIYNVLFFLLLFSYNALVLFGAGMSQGGIDSATWFGVGISFVFWAVFYLIQFIRPSKVWRAVLFMIMLIFLFFWETGLGVQVGLMIYG